MGKMGNCSLQESASARSSQSKWRAAMEETTFNEPANTANRDAERRSATLRNTAGLWEGERGLRKHKTLELHECREERGRFRRLTTERGTATTASNQTAHGAIKWNGGDHGALDGLNGCAIWRVANGSAERQARSARQGTREMRAQMHRRALWLGGERCRTAWQRKPQCLAVGGYRDTSSRDVFNNMTERH
ncbi:hypothetical protein ERJ75_001086200 [Trypanosoma vivax]|nr:hypothetical protein ERJ75_001086200 [Trypanosoma vivax]